MRPLSCYSVFHLNLAYSSIEEEARGDVLRRCYWPLLELAADFDFPIGIEAPGYTLETAAKLDPSWLAKLRELVAAGRCEFIGSGYSQLIGPLVPAEINAVNLRLGQETYERLLGVRPRLALVNEQAYSAGLIQHYLDAGYAALIMEWDNPARAHPEWKPEWRYYPQVACGQHGERIPLIWNSSIGFQKFQRYAHDQIDLEEYLSYLAGALGETRRAFPIYGSDVETFDFRAGRFDNESALGEQSEWGRIRRLADALVADERFELVSPCRVLELTESPLAGHGLQLEAAAHPIPVKKQGKYNITRWAVTGRDDLEINTRCWRLYERLRARPGATDEDWRELCYLWSSDFRTHITDRRWKGYTRRLSLFEQRIADAPPATTTSEMREPASANRPPQQAKVTRKNHWLTVDAGETALRLNCRRGLAIDQLCFGKSGKTSSLCGTLPHGFYADIRLAADFYTGHLTFEAPGRPKLTDLSDIEPTITNDGGVVEISGVIPTALGSVAKRLRIDARESRVEIHYRLDWPAIPMGSLRLGYVTLNPLAFDRESLFYRTSNGGFNRETFPLSGTTVDHGSAVSFLISAAEGIGVSAGAIELGDAHRAVRVEVDKTVAALVGFVTYWETGSTFFCRLALSACEVDETRRVGHDLVGSRSVSIALCAV